MANLCYNQSLIRRIFFLSLNDSGYMSPEYHQGGYFSTKSDIYSFGMIVLEMLVGKRCYGFINTTSSGESIGFLSYLRNH